MRTVHTLCHNVYLLTTCRSLISIMLAQGDINSTIDFTVQYRGDNLAAPVLGYNATGSHIHILRSLKIINLLSHRWQCHVQRG